MMFLTKKFNLGTILMLFCILLSACGPSPEEQSATAAVLTAAAATSTPTITPTSRVLVTSDGSELPYSIDGNGIPCVVVGDPFTPEKALSEELRRQIQFIFMHSRGNVPSESLGVTDELTLETFLDDIEELRVSLDLEKICVFGHSIYGLYALAYARQYPDHTSHVIMNATPPGHDMVIRQMADEYWRSQASEERKQALAENWASPQEPYPFCSWCSGYVKNGPKYWHDFTYDASWLLDGWYDNPDPGDLLYDLLAQYDVDAGDELTVPVFLSLGKSDFLVPYFSWDGRGATLLDLSIHVFQRSGHWPMLEEQALFDEKLIEWMYTR